MLEVDIQSKVFDSAEGTQLHAVDGLGFRVPDQSFTCLVGPSGCGKTTTLRIILGLDENYTGSVSFGEGGTVAAVFQDPRLLPWRTVRQNVELARYNHDPDADDLVDALFEELGLADHQHFFPSELSLGLARRVALARAYATRPSLLILDEPFVSLDDRTADRLRRLLLQVWQSRPTTVLMVTHNVREAAELADSILLLSERPARIIEELKLAGDKGSRSDDEVDKIVARINFLRPGIGEES